MNLSNCPAPHLACRYNRTTAALLVALLLAGCATTAPNGGDALEQMHLFDAGGAPRFSLYYSCAGQVAAETELCWVPSKYFAQWAYDRHVAITELASDAAFDANIGVPASQRARSEAGVDYRVVVRFAPYVTPSYTSENTGMGGFVPPKAGYLANVYVYAAGDGRLVAQADYHKRVDAPFKADAVPYVKSGVQAVLAAVDPAYAFDIEGSNTSAHCAERPGRSVQGCGEHAAAHPH